MVVGPIAGRTLHLRSNWGKGDWERVLDALAWSLIMRVYLLIVSCFIISFWKQQRLHNFNLGWVDGWETDHIIDVIS